MISRVLHILHFYLFVLTFENSLIYWCSPLTNTLIYLCSPFKFLSFSNVFLLSYDTVHYTLYMYRCSPMTYIICTLGCIGAHLLFVEVVLISCGKLMYFGKRREMLPYFAFIEYPCPAYKNPSDYYRKFKKMAKNVLIIII